MDKYLVRNVFTMKLNNLLDAYHIPGSALAKHLKISNQHMSSIRLGKQSPNLAVLVGVADFFNTTVDYLLRK